MKLRNCMIRYIVPSCAGMLLLEVRGREKKLATQKREESSESPNQTSDDSLNLALSNTGHI